MPLSVPSMRGTPRSLASIRKKIKNLEFLIVYMYTFTCVCVCAPASHLHVSSAEITRVHPSPAPQHSRRNSRA